VQTVAENLRREGLEPEPVFVECREVLESRLREYVRGLGREVVQPSLSPQAALTGEAYTFYRGDFSTQARDGELAALMSLEGQLSFARPPSTPAYLSQPLMEGMARVELAFAQTRLKFLRGWLTQLFTALPAPQTLQNRDAVEQVFDRLVKSRIPLLLLKEGELVRLRGVLSVLNTLPGELGEGARKLEVVLRSIDEDFSHFSKQVLELRTSR
jgi:hypothetical protein